MSALPLFTTPSIQTSASSSTPSQPNSVHPLHFPVRVVRADGGCKRFCVNGQLAANCLTLKRSEYDRSNETSPAPDLIDQLLAGYRKPEDLIGEHGLLKRLTKAVVERALQARCQRTLGMANMSRCQPCWQRPQWQQPQDTQG